MQPGKSDFFGEFDDEEISLWLAFNHMTGLGIDKAKSLWGRFGSMKEAWTASREDLIGINGWGNESISTFLSKRKELEPQRLLEIMRTKNVDAYPYYHPLYPQRLRVTHDPPLVLYIKGQLTPEDAFYSIAIVGTRKPTAYGKHYAREIACDLAGNGVTVVSGMAIGIDSVAHRGAREAKGRTIAVLACGPDVCYPSSNRSLYDELIAESNGAIISEYFPGTPPEKWQFPTRNRIISGLSHGVLVIEGDITSGSLITAKIAFEQSRLVFALPGRVDSATSDGPNDLIARNMAHLTRGYKDIMAELNWESTFKGEGKLPAVVQLFGREREVYEMLSAEPVHFDQLCQKAGMHAGEMSGTLTMLELAGIITRHHGDWYSREGRSFINSAADNS